PGLSGCIYFAPAAGFRRFRRMQNDAPGDRSCSRGRTGNDRAAGGAGGRGKAGASHRGAAGAPPRGNAMHRRYHGAGSPGRGGGMRMKTGMDLPHPPAVDWKEDRLLLLDQRRLPTETVYLELTRPEEVREAIRELAVR